MKLQKLVCPNCNASLNMELMDGKDTIFCPYCGQQFYIDTEKREYTFNQNVNKNVNIHKTIQHMSGNIDKAEEARASAKKEMYSTLLIGFMFLCGFGMLGMDKFEEWSIKQEAKKSEQQGKIKIGSTGDFKGKNYEAIVAQLQALGFEDIETIDLDDAGFFTKDGSIESISVNGNPDFGSDDYFFTTDKIVITYH